MTDATSFPPDPVSVPAARRFVRTTLDELGLSAAWDAAEMLVSEVATNAVLHARTAFTVDVTHEADRVRVSVRDASPALPRQRSYGVDSTTGRGLRLMSSLATAWGVESHATGKTVWFEVPANGDASSVPEPWEAEVDLDDLLAGFEDLEPAEDEGRAPRALRNAA